MSAVQHYGTGRRKRAVARVFLRPGSGRFLVNNQDAEQYFKNPILRTAVRFPLALTETNDSFDALVTVRGGGHAGQAGAIRHGVARALVEANAELRSKLRQAGLLTRDSRIKERKKYGQKGARARFQFSKR
ncbi:MAG: 30S ribosomal protein S9 [Acidobacteriota bacterium]